MLLEIEKGIEVPSGRCETKYPFSRMEVGDSFFVPCAQAVKRKLQSNLGAYGLRCASNQKSGQKFVTRQVEGGIRVWRVA